MCVYSFVFGCTVVLISVFLFQYFFIPPPPVIYLLFALVMFSQRRRRRSGEKLHLCVSFRKKKSMFLFNWLQFSCTVRPSTKQLRFAPLVCSRTTQDLVTCFPEGSRPLTRITENTSYALHNLPHKSNTPEIFITRPLMTLSTQSFKNISMCCE